MEGLAPDKSLDRHISTTKQTTTRLPQVMKGKKRCRTASSAAETEDRLSKRQQTAPEPKFTIPTKIQNMNVAPADWESQKNGLLETIERLETEKDRIHSQLEQTLSSEKLAVSKVQALISTAKIVTEREEKAKEG